MLMNCWKPLKSSAEDWTGAGLGSANCAQYIDATSPRFGKSYLKPLDRTEVASE